MLIKHVKTTLLNKRFRNCMFRAAEKLGYVGYKHKTGAKSLGRVDRTFVSTYNMGSEL